jgi:GNAT superfamily N-acetyltransferase
LACFPRRVTDRALRNVLCDHPDLTSLKAVGVGAVGSVAFVDDARMYATMLDSLRASYRLGASGARDSRFIELDGVTASIVPATPNRSVVNAVVYDDADALKRALPELAREYEDAGVRAWTVWVPDVDRRAAEMLRRAGHALDASPRAMALDLATLSRAPGPEPEWDNAWDMPGIGLVNDRAYGDSDGLWASALGQLPGGSAHVYIARDGDPVSFVMVHDHGTDCVFWFAATIPEARGHGLAGGLLHRALLDARDRGLRTSTTQATAMGRPVYERIGYRDLGPIHMYERRRG